MRIRSITTAVVEANFDWTIVRVETDEGLVGWGECFFAPGLTGIVRDLAALAVGEDARHHVAVVARLRAAASGAGSVGGIVHNALSGIDAALWDLNARALGVPLWRLLGGRAHDAVRVYADCHGGNGLMSLGPVLNIRQPRWSNPEDVAAGRLGRMLFDPDAETEEIDLALLEQRAAAAVQLGFDALKFDLDVPGLVPTKTGSRSMPLGGEALIASMTDAIVRGAGEGVEIAFDLHWRYDMSSAGRIAETLSGRPIMWLEDPLPPENVSGLITLSGRTTTPIGGGENLIGFRSFEAVLRAQALAVVTPDLGKVGGVVEARRVAEVAADNGIAVAPHNIAGPVGTAFAAQVAATWPNLLALEYHAQDVPFFDDLVDRPIIERGSILMTDRPGIGVEVNVEEVRRWSKPNEPVFA